MYLTVPSDSPLPGGFNTGSGMGILDHTGKPWRQSQGYEAGMAVPHVISFMSIFSSAYKAYAHGLADEAIRFNRNEAYAMRNDPHLMRLLRERIDSVVCLKWRICTEDDDDPQHKAIRDALTTIFKYGHRFKSMLKALSEAIWYGRYAVQKEYQPRMLLLPDPDNPNQKKWTRCNLITNHEAVEGDKLGNLWDNTTYMLVNSAKITDVPHMEVVNTTNGRAVLLKGTVRDKFIIHRHNTLDAPYWQGDMASSIYGVGIRSVLFYMWWMEKEMLAHMMAYIERTGLGLRVWYFDPSNPTSKAAVEAAAKSQTDRTNILVPRLPSVDGRGGREPAIEVLDTSTAGAEFLLKVVKEWKDEMALYAIGQTLSSGTEGSGLGGTGVARMHSETKNQLITLDAENLAETITQDELRKQLAWTFPDHADLPIWFEFILPPHNAAERMQLANTAYSMGASLKEDEVLELASMTLPKEGDRTLSLAQQQQNAAAMAPAGGLPGDGDNDGLVNEDEDKPDMDFLGDSLMRELQMEGAAA